MVDRRIVLFGATGRTGRLVAGELAGNAGVVLVARDPVALAEVGDSAGLATATADLRGLAGRLVPGDVLLSCVGPYDAVGEQVVETAIRSGVTYLDVTGEPAFLWRLHERLGPRAATAGVTLLPAVGYEYLPGQLLAEEVITAVGGAHTVEVAYLADGGLRAGSASGRRSLVRALTRPTTTFRRGHHQREWVAARRGRFVAGGQARDTVSLGGAEVWSVPARHRGVDTVDVHTGWFGPFGPAVQLLTRLAGPARRLALDQLLDVVVAAAGDGPDAGLAEGTSRFVARVRDDRGRVVARREAVAGNPIVLAARLAAGTAEAVAGADLRDLPVGVTDPVSALGQRRLAAIAQWAGVVEV